MSRTITLLALALIAHVTLVAALAHACGPQCGKYQSSYNNSHQHNKPQFQLGSRASNGSKSGVRVVAEPAPLPQTTTTNQPTTKKTQEQLSDHPLDLPTNDPPFVAAK